MLGVLVALVSASASMATPAANVLTPAQRHVADELVSIFENSSPTIRYDYIEDLHDGCGLTAGRAGFCSATGDMLETVEAYAQRRPDNGLVAYLPVLRRRAASGSASTDGLGRRFVAAWRAASRDMAFRAAQDDVVDELYFEPAAERAAAIGLRTPLAVAIFYDTAIEHGTAQDADGLPALVARTRRRARGLPAAPHITERRWLMTFLAVRRADLLAPHNRARRVDWPDSVGRVDALAHLLRAGHADLEPPLAVDPWGDNVFTLTR
ncbi:Chitosanase [Baekduia alba]|nr:Chitosanase [Baekduia alba]